MDAKEGKGVTRRQFLSWAITSVVAFIAAALGIPIVGYVVSPALKGEEKPWNNVGSINDIKVGVPTRVEYTIERKDGWIETTDLHSAWVVRKSPDVLVVFDPRCTHLGCPYSWDPSTQKFFCPCHTAVFDIDGKVISGPPPRPLDQYSYKIENNQLFILEEAPHAG